MHKFLFVVTVVGLLTVRADVTVSDVLVNQRWPWSEKVDVDFLVSGGATEAKVTAVWDGRSTPYELGTVCEAKSGWNRLTWNPDSSPFADQTLTGFSVSVTPVEPPTNRYLIVDLENGGVTYAARPDGTDGRWTDACKTTKMVFRRIPAGTYYLGIESNQLAKVYGKPIAGTYSTAWARHDVTFTSDFYVGVFKMTVAQYELLSGGSVGTGLQAKKVSYDELRGSVDEGVNWPSSRHEVASNSLVAKLRAKAGPVDFDIDLCHECQWEAAMRANTTTFWPNGGTMEDSPTAMTNIVDTISWRGKSQVDVGLKVPNDWGIYDPVGIVPDWTIGYAASTGTSTLPKNGLKSATDPVGSSSSEAKRRVIRGSGDSHLYNTLPCVRQVIEHATTNAAARFCIHLKPLKFP